MIFWVVFRSTSGAEAYAMVATVLQTAHKRGPDALGTLIQALGSTLDPNLLPQPP